MLNNVHFKSKFWFKIEKMGLFLVKKVGNKKSAHFELKLLLQTYANQRGSVLIYWKMKFSRELALKCWLLKDLFIF